MAAMHFSRIPPTGRTLPESVIYPVIDKLFLTGSLEIKETRHVTIVTPADGPSFLMPPAGKWMWRDILSRSSVCSLILKAYSPPHRAKSFLFALIQDKAMWIDSFMTSPSWPVTSILGLLSPIIYLIASTTRSFPPIWVQAIPFTTPTPSHLYSSFLSPKI